MKIRLYLLLLSILILTSCSDDSLPSSVSSEQSPEELNASVKANATITGLTRFKVANLNIPSGGLVDGQRFYSDKSLRANNSYYPYAIMKTVHDGRDRLRFYVKPTAPTYCLVGTQYPYHHRAEFTRYPWLISLPYKTEEWIGFSYIFPTSGFTQNRTPVSIYQNHAGRTSAAVHPPAFYMEIAWPGQLRNSLDPYYYTPLGGEIMIINAVRGFRWVVPGVRVKAGARLDIVMQIVYGVGNDGLLNIWINGKLMTFPGSKTVPAGNVGSTVWPANPVGGNSKFGIYHHMLIHKTCVDLNASKGHTNMVMYMTDWNDVFRKPGDWDYKNINAYAAVSTAAYP